MDRRGQSVSGQYRTVDEALRWALVRMAEQAGRSHYLIAPEIDMSPSHFSKALNPHKSEDDQERRHHFPADRIARYTEVTGDLSYLLTLLDALGYDPARLEEIKRPTKTTAQLQEELIAQVRSAQATIQRVAEQLPLMVPLAATDGATRKRGRVERG